MQPLRTDYLPLPTDYHYAPPNLLAGQGQTHRHRLPLPTVYPYAPATPTHAPVAATSTRHRHRCLAAAHAHAPGQAVRPTNNTGYHYAPPNLLAGQGRAHRHRLPLPTGYPYAPATPTHAPVATTSTRHRHRTIASAHATHPVRHSDPQTAQTTTTHHLISWPAKARLTGTGFPYPQSTPTRRRRRLPLPTHLSPPLPPTTATDVSQLHTRTHPENIENSWLMVADTTYNISRASQ